MCVYVCGCVPLFAWECIGFVVHVCGPWCACMFVIYCWFFQCGILHMAFTLLLSVRGESNLAWIRAEMSGNYPSIIVHFLKFGWPTFFISLNSWSPPNSLPFTRNLAGVCKPILPWDKKTQSWSHSHSYKPKIKSIGNWEIQHIDIDPPTLLVVSGFLSTWNWTEDY